LAEVSVVVEAEVRPTEDQEKVLKAVKAFFDPETLRVERAGRSTIIVASSRAITSLEKLHQALRIERILDAARKAMKRGVQGGTLVFYIHKQAALKGRLSFVSSDAESPLGAIKFVISHPDPDKVIDWLAPPTRQGKPLYERSPPE